ncbi:MAG: hypothetical protein RH862_03735 [Leptospiraceae bacterium]
MKLQLPISVLLILLSASPLVQSFAEEEISYPLTTFKYFRQNVPLPEPGDSDIKMDMRLLRFSAVVRYQGKYRPLTESKKKTMDLLEGMNVFHGKTAFFDHEILIKDRMDRELWIPANGALATRIHDQLEVNEEFTAMFTYLGCCFDRKDRILFLNRIDFNVQHIPEHSCFTEELLGFKIRSNFKESLRRAEEKFGKPVKTLESERGQRVHIFLIEKDTETAMYLRDGGPEFSDYVSSIQISSYAGSNMELMPGIAFGDKEKDIEDAIGRDLRIRHNKDADLHFYEPSACTFELRDGRMFSIFISEDPYY